VREDLFAVLNAASSEDPWPQRPIIPLRWEFTGKVLRPPVSQAGVSSRALPARASAIAARLQTGRCQGKRDVLFKL
jgi:hypothetical protein